MDKALSAGKGCVVVSHISTAAGVKATDINPTYYQIPYRDLLTGKFPNVLMAGRMLDAEPNGFVAIRVMVNLNQLGEAAGVAAYLAMKTGANVQHIDTIKLKKILADGGSIVL
jgi:hypothetical protein